MAKVLVVYYSKTGNTGRLADQIEQELVAAGKEIEKIRLAEEKGHSFLRDALRALFRVKGKIKEANFNLEGYDAIFFGTPVWAGSPAPALNKYLEKCRGLEGKEVSIFITYGSGLGKGRAMRILEKIIEEKGGRVIQKLAVQEKEVFKERLRLVR